jgi:hypothetical protein
LSARPVERPRNWTALVNEPVPAVEQKRLEVSFQRGRPPGSDAWTTDMAEKLGLEHTLNPLGRPKIHEE